MVFFKINSKTLSRNPASIEHGKIKIQNSDRTIDGTLVIDLIAIKDTVECKWDYMSDADLRKLVSEAEANSFCTISYFDTTVNAGEMKTITVQADDISYAPYFDYRSQSIMWKDVSISFIER